MIAIIRMIDLDSYTMRVGFVPDDYPAPFTKKTRSEILDANGSIDLAEIAKRALPVVIQAPLSVWMDLFKLTDERYHARKDVPHVDIIIDLYHALNRSVLAFDSIPHYPPGVRTTRTVNAEKYL
jgi:hypothetical protein